MVLIVACICLILSLGSLPFSLRDKPMLVVNMCSVYAALSRHWKIPRRIKTRPSTRVVSDTAPVGFTNLRSRSLMSKPANTRMIHHRLKTPVKGNSRMYRPGGIPPASGLGQDRPVGVDKVSSYEQSA